MTIRVLIADDQSMVRAGFRMLLSGEQDIDVVAEARDGLEAVAAAARLDPTVILMDIRMPGLDGLSATRQITADPALAGVRILILTTFELDEYLFDALRHGASGFLVKDTEPGDLVTVDLLSPSTAGTGADEHTAVFAATAADVTQVIAGGRLVFDGDHGRVGRALGTAIERLWT